ncbi:MAG: hypothetical protein AAGK79_20040 [Pseudomonadota bacterium]
MSANSQTKPFLEAMACLTEFETSGSATEWTHDGFHVWPIVKYVLVKQLIAAMNRGYAPTDAFATYRGFAERRRPLTGLKGRLRLLKEYHRARALLPVQDLRKNPIWFFGSASGLSQLGDVTVSQHHHAFRAAFWTKGTSSVGLYSATEKADFSKPLDYGPDHSIDAFIQYTIKKARTNSIVGPYLEMHFARLDDVVKITGHPKESLFAFIDLMIGRTAHVIRSLAPVLRTARPKAVLMGNYASFYGWGLVYLCRRFGIPFVDIQHGLQGRYGGAYHFSRTPKGDWSVFPPRQLCWTQSDALAFRGPSPHRKAAVSGPTWSRFAEFLPADQTEVLELPYELRTGSGPLVLFAGQKPDDIYFAEKLRQRGLRILYRSHPTQKDLCPDNLEGSCAAALHTEFASKATLPALLNSVDGLVTGYSAVILEACLKQVPCFATGAFADLLHEDYEAEITGLLRTCGDTDKADLLATVSDWCNGLTQRQAQADTGLLPIADALSEIGLDSER